MSGIPNFPDHGEGIVPRPIENSTEYCLNLAIKTNLSSVDVDVLCETKAGEVLPVTALTVDGPVVVMKDERILGTVLSSLLLELLTCMNGGTKYEATIIKIEGALCQVKIVAVK